MNNLFYVHCICRTWNKNKYVDCVYGSYQRDETPVALEVRLVEKCINVFVVSHCFMCERSDTGAFHIPPPPPKPVLPPSHLS